MPRSRGCCSRSVEAAVHAITECEHQSGEKQRQLELALEQARGQFRRQPERARRQYDTVDPDNRLVAGELERRWNTALAAVRALEEELRRGSTAAGGP